MSLIKYEYRIVGKRLVDDLFIRFEMAEPFVLLGPPGAGKRLLLAKLRSRLDKLRRPWVAVVLREHVSIASEQALLAQLKEPDRFLWSPYIDSARIQKLSDASTLEEFFAALSEIDEQHQSLPLVFANLDGLTDQLLFRLLTLIRLRQDKLVPNRRPTFVLTGERPLLELVGNKSGPVQPIHQFVVQAHDEEMTAEFCRKRIEAMQLRFSPDWSAEEAIDLLHKLSQGDINVIRAALLAVSEYRLRFECTMEMDLGVPRAVFEQSLRNFISVPLYGLKLFYLARNTIEHHEDMFDLVEELLDQLVTCATCKDNPKRILECWDSACVYLNEGRWLEYVKRPTPLELTGLVKRDSRTLELRFSSPYAADYAYHYFNMSCRGDFLVRQRRFEEALERYRKVPSGEVVQRPRNNADYQLIRNLINRLCRHFIETATFPDADGRFFRRFQDFAKGLLRFETVSMWRYRAERCGWEEIQPRRAMSAPPILDSVPFGSLIIGERALGMQMYHDDRWPEMSAYALRLEHPANDGVCIVFEDQKGVNLFAKSRSRAAASLTHHFLLAWHHARDRFYLSQQRSKLGDALARMLRPGNLQESLKVLATYMKEAVFAHAVRLYLSPPGKSDVLVSKFQVGLESGQLADAFDRGEIVLSKAEYPLMFGAAETAKPTLFRWTPPDFEPPPGGDSMLDYCVVKDNPHAQALERRPGDYWIDFPLFQGREFFGKLTLAFRSEQPPPRGTEESLETVSELLAQHIGNLHEGAARFAELKSIQRKAIAGVAHDLATRIGSLPIFAEEFRLLGEEIADSELRKRVTGLSQTFKERLDEAFNTLKLAKEWLAPIPVGTDVFKIGRAIERSLPTVDRKIGDVMLLGDVSIPVKGREDHIDAAFRELISDSCAMYHKGSGLQIKVVITRKVGDLELQIDYRDNGPGVPSDRKEWIFEYFNSHRPGQKHNSTGLGLGRVREIIHAHGGTICEIGIQAHGVHFRITLPIHNQSS